MLTTFLIIFQNEIARIDQAMRQVSVLYNRPDEKQASDL
jgi:hypothetical protein